MRVTYALVGTGALAVCCLGVGAWVAARRQPEAESRAPAAPPTPTDKHFTGTVHFDVLAKLLDDDRRSAPADEWLRELADPKANFHVETQTHALLHHAAPDFTLHDRHGQPWRLQGQIGRGPVVLVFYLGYACNACVHDLFELNADLPRFHSLGAKVVAVSGDSPAFTQRRFEQYGAFGFPVLSDPGHAVARSYGTCRPARTPALPSRERGSGEAEPEELLHGTFLISREGHVHWVHYGDTPFRNNKALLYALARLENKLPPPEPPLGTAGKEPETP